MSETFDVLPQRPAPEQIHRRERAAWLGGVAAVRPDLDDSQGEQTQQRACVGEDPELFFPDRTDDARITDAKRICQTCVVRTKCLEEALVGGIEFGIWGGLTEHERRKIKRRSI